MNNENTNSVDLKSGKGVLSTPIRLFIRMDLRSLEEVFGSLKCPCV
jgi:hypothetical protein